MDKELIRDIIEWLRECADDLSDALKAGDDDDLECCVDEVQYTVLTAGKALKEML